jgi:3-oxoacyl-[acyl-carrier protein] reductase
LTKRLDDKVAVITGAAQGIGSAIAKRFAAEGASVVINYLTRKDEAERTMSAIQSEGGTACLFKADITKASEVQALFAETVERFGGVDVLVNNAGLNEKAPLQQITEEHFHKHFNVNVLGLLQTSREAARYLEASHGCILNISSLTSIHPARGSAVYGGSKAAVDAITATLALELGPSHIRVNSISPGVVSFMTSNVRDQIAAMTPLRRLGEPEDIAAAALILCSHDARWITGQSICVTGGLM